MKVKLISIALALSLLTARTGTAQAKSTDDPGTPHRTHITASGSRANTYLPKVKPVHKPKDKADRLPPVILYACTWSAEGIVIHCDIVAILDPYNLPTEQ